MFCEQCGKEIPEDSAFCTECGHKAEAPPEAQAAAATPPGGGARPGACPTAIT
jgi:uncharacterized membrane protein YvbJ